MTIRKVYSWLHLWLGIATGLVFLIASFTGAALVFEEEAEELFHPSFYRITGTVPQGSRYSLDSLAAIAKNVAGPYGIEKITINPASDHHYIFRSEEIDDRQFLIAINPYNGKIAGIRREDSRFFVIMEDLHRKLLMDKPGKFITGICCLSYLLILITGLILWWPKNIKILKQRIKVKWDAKPKRLNWDLHSVSGFYAFPFLLIMTFTGLTWSFDWFENGIYLVFDGKVPEEVEYEDAKAVNYSQTSSLLERVNRQAKNILPYEGHMEIGLPTKKNMISLEKSIPEWFSGRRDKLSFDGTSGSLIGTELWKDLSAGSRTRDLMKPIHTGSIFGIISKILAFLACLIGVSLPVTGLIIWLGRKKKKKVKKAV
jgi:uncharacterized iron-regulated membrane protein